MWDCKFKFETPIVYIYYCQNSRNFVNSTILWWQRITTCRQTMSGSGFKILSNLKVRYGKISIWFDLEVGTSRQRKVSYLTIAGGLKDLGLNIEYIMSLSLSRKLIIEIVDTFESCHVYKLEIKISHDGCGDCQLIVAFLVSL